MVDLTRPKRSTMMAFYRSDRYKPMADVSYFSKSSALLLRTLPYIALNAVVYGGFFLASAIWMSIWGGLAWAFSGFAPILSYVCVIVGFAAGGGIIKWLKRYVLYMVKGGHIATLTAMLRGTDAPSGFEQIQWGKQKIEQHFTDVSMLFGLDTLINGTLKAMSRKLIRITNWLPLPDSATGLVRTATQIMNRSLTYVDEAILSYAIYRDEESVWDSARHGVLLYAQSYKPILWTAVKIWLAGKLFFVAVLVVVGIPAILLMMAFPNTAGLQLIGIALALFAAWAVQAAFFEPFAMTYTLVTYHYEIADKVPDPEWDERLQGVSTSFRELVGKAGPLVPRAFRPLTRPNL